MPAMSRAAKLAIIFSAIGAAVAIGITIATVYNQTGGSIFQRLAGKQDDDSSQFNKEYTLGYHTRYSGILAVGEEGTYYADAKSEKPPFSFEWKFSDGLTLTGQKVTRSFDLPGRYLFNLTVTDGTGKHVTSTELNTNVVQAMPKKEGTGNTTLTH
jgi:PKD repeat protein